MRDAVGSARVLLRSAWTRSGSSVWMARIASERASGDRSELGSSSADDPSGLADLRPTVGQRDAARHCRFGPGVPAQQLVDMTRRGPRIGIVAVMGTTRDASVCGRSFSSDSRQVILPRVGSRVGTLPRHGLLPADISGPQHDGRGFACFPRHQEDAGQKGFPSRRPRPFSPDFYRVFYRTRQQTSPRGAVRRHCSACRQVVQAPDGPGPVGRQRRQD